LAQAVNRDGCWFLVVSENDLANSIQELDAYRQENPDRATRGNALPPVFGGAIAGVFLYSVIVILIAVLSTEGAYGLDWFPAGRMQAGKVMAGEWWRTVTALTLHLDSGHVAGNLLFGVVFGLLAGQALGGGVAWLAIVIAGALGNFMNAVVQAPSHTSIGASTAVFAALGVIVSHALRPRGRRETRLRRWSPLVGGVLLLAFVGVGGERTDVTAHLTGFLAGMTIGWLGCGLPHAWLAHRTVQVWSGGAAIAIVATAWFLALNAVPK
jgi:membrane associated rhomboid family serine protease